MRPIVYVETRGGVAYIFSSGDVEIAELDWDDIDETDRDEVHDELSRVQAQLLPYTTEGDNTHTFKALTYQIDEYLNERYTRGEE